MLGNAPNFVEKRLFVMSIYDKLNFIYSLQNAARTTDGNLGMLEMSEFVKERMAGVEVLCMDETTKLVLADIILIGVDKNQQHVRSVAANYRTARIQATQPSRRKPTTDKTCPPSMIVTNNNEPSRVSDESRNNEPQTSRSSTDLTEENSFSTESTMNGLAEHRSTVYIKTVTPQSPIRLFHAWSTATNLPEQAVKQLIVQEYNTNILRYTAAGVSANEFYDYIEHGKYTFDAADTIIDMLCNATGRTAIIIGKKYTNLARGQSTIVYGVTEMNRIGSSIIASSCVLLLKSGGHYDSLF
jgi:hypothetical protein